MNFWEVLKFFKIFVQNSDISKKKLRSYLAKGFFQSLINRLEYNKQNLIFDSFLSLNRFVSGSISSSIWRSFVEKGLKFNFLKHFLSVNLIFFIIFCEKVTKVSNMLIVKKGKKFYSIINKIIVSYLRIFLLSRLLYRKQRNYIFTQLKFYRSLKGLWHSELYTSSGYL